MRLRRCRLVVTLAATTLLASASLAAPTPAADKLADKLDDNTRAAVDRGLKWLSLRWSPDAPADVVAAREKGPGRTAVTALGGLAFLAADDAKPGEGRYGAALGHCLKTLLDAQHDDGLFATDRSHGPMYGHAFATLFVAEALARSNDAALRKPLERAVRLIERAQNADGGGRYQPKPLDADVSVTAVQLIALRAAERAGIAVQAKVIEAAAGYVAKLRNDDGGFRYMLHPQANGSGVPRTAAATVALEGCGKADAKDRARALDYLARTTDRMRAENGPGFVCDHFYYRGYHLAHALWQAGGEYREKHLPQCQQDLLRIQSQDGSWRGDLTPEYATAMALIALQVPEERLAMQRPRLIP
jgi:hypothetical protein